MNASPQHGLPFPPGWGGSRNGAGRKPSAKRAGLRHVARPEHARRHPVHVTLRAARRGPTLRRQSVFFEIRRAFARTTRSWFRLVHFSVQSDHIHLIVEAQDKAALSRGVAGLSIRVARAVNRVLGCRGKVWADRYHARALRTPREVRHGLVYVIANRRKHAPKTVGLDPCSSAWWFDGWKVPPTCEPPAWESTSAPVEPAGTWLARTGWKRHGLVRSNEGPRAAK